MAALTDHFAFAWGAGQPSLARSQEMFAVGAKWVRFELEWTNIEPTTKGTFSGWANYDTAIQAAESAGLKVLAILSTTPSWARTLPGNPYWSPPAVPQNYADFATAAVNRYKPGGTLGTNVRHWELWNEPNLSAFWGSQPDPVKLAAMMIAAYPAIKAADPLATVVSAGMAPAGPYGESTTAQMNGLTYLERLFTNGAGQKFDAVGWHPYDSGGFAYHPSSAWSQMVETPVSVRTILTANNRSSVPIWATEHGVKAPTWTTEATAAARLTEAYLRWGNFAFPKGPLFWFTYRNNLTDANEFSIVDPVSGTPRTRYTAYRDAPRDTSTPSSGTSTYSATVLATSGIQSYWKLGESSGNFIDSMGVASLTPSGTPGYNQTSLNSEADGSVLFSGDDVLDGGDIYDYAGNTAHSVEFIMEPAEINTGTFYLLVVKMNTATTDGWWVLLNRDAAGGTRILYERKGGGGSGGASGWATINVGQTVRVLVTYDGAAVATIYANGVAIGQSNIGAVSIAGHTDPFRVGGHTSLTPFKGKMARVALYNRVLTAGEDTTHQAAMTVVSGSGGAYGRPVIDNFNRANEAALAAPWVTPSGATGGMALVSNQATGRSAAYGDSYRDATHGPSVETYVTIAAKPADADPFYLRLATSITSSSTWNGYEVEFTAAAAGTDSLKINRQSGATSTQLGATVSQEFDVGDVLELALNGDAVELWRRPSSSTTWALVATRTDTTHRATTTAGWLKAKNQVVKLEDFGLGTFVPTSTFIDVLGAIPASTAWPGGGTLGDAPASSSYGNEGFTLGDAPADARYPPGS